LAEKEIMLKV